MNKKTAIQQLTEKNKELEQALTMASAYVSQVLRERDELRRLLAEKDGRLDKGMTINFRGLAEDHQARPTEGRLSGKRLWPFGGRSAGHLKSEFVDSSTNSPPPKTSLPKSRNGSCGDPKSDQSIFGDQEKHPTLATLVVGLDGDALASVLDVISAHCAERQVKPLMITDSDETWQFRERELFLEYLPYRPAHRSRLDESLDWDLYIKRRLRLIRKKWQPSWTLSFGEDAERLAALWNDSPVFD